MSRKSNDAHPGWAEISPVPSWLWGGRASGLFEAADLLTKPGSHIESLLVRTREAHFRQLPDLLRLIKAAGPAATPNGLNQLTAMSDDDVDESGRALAHEALTSMKTDGTDMLPMLIYYQLATASVETADLPEQCTNALESLLAVRVTESGDQAFPHAGIYAVRRQDALLHRIKLISVLLRLQHDAELAAGDLTAIKQLQAADENVFASSEGLHTGYYLLEAFIGPVLGALSPGIWGVAAMRGYGPVILSLGHAVAGTTPLASNFIGTLPTQGADRVEHFDALPPDAIPTALQWWVSRLNEVFGVISDPLIAVDRHGEYSAALHLQAVLTMEQLFRRTLSVQANHHDLNARRVLLFTVLDTLESLTGRGIDINCDAYFARRTLERVQASIPEDAHPLLLPRARRAVDALEEVQQGFFLRAQDGRVTVEPSKGRTLTPAKAVAQYLKVLRNATHGHGAKSQRALEATDTLLACHNGRLPHDISLLAWLYLLDLMSSPAYLRAHLASRSSRSG
jgi:hypothetical protein